jgi:hypothetical protein
MFARVATRDEMKPLVVVELVVVRELAVSEFEERDVVVALVSTALVAVRLVNTAVTALRRVEKSDDDVALVNVVDATERDPTDTDPAVSDETVVVASAVVPVSVLSPANVCVPVETTPRAEAPASGMLMVCVEPTEEIETSLPEVPTVKN